MTAAGPFSRAEVAAFLARADAILAAPPARPWIERHPGRGRLVLRFALPLALAAPQNRSRHAQGWQMAEQRKAVLSTLAGQMMGQFARDPSMITAPLNYCRNGKGLLPVWPSPLSARPQVRAVRFSSVAPDCTAAWHKTTVDCLLPPKTRAGKVVPGLGILADDRPALLEVRDWWEAAPKGQGGALVEVFDGTG